LDKGIVQNQQGCSHTSTWRNWIRWN